MAQVWVQGLGAGVQREQTKKPCGSFTTSLREGRPTNQLVGRASPVFRRACEDSHGSQIHKTNLGFWNKMA